MSNRAHAVTRTERLDRNKSNDILPFRVYLFYGTVVLDFYVLDRLLLKLHLTLFLDG